MFPRFRPRLTKRRSTHAASALRSRAFGAHGDAVVAARRSTGRLRSPARSPARRHSWTRAPRSAQQQRGEPKSSSSRSTTTARRSIRFGDDVTAGGPNPARRLSRDVSRRQRPRRQHRRRFAWSISQRTFRRLTRLRNPLPARAGRIRSRWKTCASARRWLIACRNAPSRRRIMPKSPSATPDVQRAAATFRWTGSWHTVFLTVDRSAGAAVSEEFEDRHARARRALSHGGPRSRSRRPALRRPGNRSACRASPADHFRSDVERELFDVLSNRELPDGRRGLFHPDNFTFGQPVYLSAIYAAAHQVAGVESVEVRTFQRLGVPDNAALGKRPARHRPAGDRAPGQRSQFRRARRADDFAGRRQMSRVIADRVE